MEEVESVSLRASLDYGCGCCGLGIGTIVEVLVLFGGVCLLLCMLVLDSVLVC